MKSTHKTAQQWRRNIFCCRCCPARFNIFDTTKTAAAPSDLVAVGNMNRNGEVIVTQPGLSNNNVIHYTNGDASRGAEKPLRRLGNDNSLDREFDEIDLGDGIFIKNEPHLSSQRTDVETYDRLEPRDPDKNPSASTGSSSGVDTLTTVSVSSKPQSVKSSGAAYAPVNDNSALTPKLTDIMLSDVIQEHFDLSDELPQIIEEDISKIDTNVVTEATAEEVKDARKSPRSKPETISIRSYDSDSLVTSSAVDYVHTSPKKPPRVTANGISSSPFINDDIQCSALKSNNEENSKAEEKETEALSANLPSASDSSPSATPIQSNDYELENLQKYGDFHETAKAPTKTQMYGDVDEYSNSSYDDDDDSDNKKEVLVVHAAGTVSSDAYEELQNEQADSETSELPPRSKEHNLEREQQSQHVKQIKNSN